MTGNDFLSQDEIDALLKQGNEEQSDAVEGTNEILTEFEKDALGEIGNISFGTAATALSTLLRRKVEITTPTVAIVHRDKLKNDLPYPHVVIKVDYIDGFVGSNVLAIRTQDAQVIADLMLGGDGKTALEELNELHMSAVGEAMNQMMGSAATSMSTIFNMMVNISPPSVEVLTFDDQNLINLFPEDEVFAKISFRLLVGDLIDSHIMQLVPISFAKIMLSKLTGKKEEGQNMDIKASANSEHAQKPAQEAATAINQQPVTQPATVAPPYQNPAAVPNMQNPTGMPMGYSPANGYGMPPGGTYAAQTVNVQPAQFASFDPSNSATMANSNINLLMDIPLQVTVELGRTRKQIQDILELGPGSILELDKLAGEPVDILVNSKLIAKGEVVVIDENFGVRVTDIITPSERITKLQ